MKSLLFALVFAGSFVAASSAQADLKHMMPIWCSSIHPEDPVCPGYRAIEREEHREEHRGYEGGYGGGGYHHGRR